MSNVNHQWFYMNKTILSEDQEGPITEEKFADFKGSDPFIPRSASQFEDWVIACKGGDPTLSNFEYAGLLTEANHLGNVAYRSG
ncbi:MAG: hypothetical protein OSA89_15370 [Mariniblastus sp.]|nr:hypothetical protein [Mariniblastus sp.]